MGRVFKDFIFWAHSQKAKPQIARMQIDTASDRTILAKLPPGGVVTGQGCINGQTVDLVEIIASIPGTECSAKLKVAIRPTGSDLPAVIGTDFFQATKPIIDYDGEVIGCPSRRRPKSRKGFAGNEQTGVMRFTPGACKPPSKR